MFVSFSKSLNSIERSAASVFKELMFPAYIVDELGAAAEEAAVLVI